MGRLGRLRVNAHVGDGEVVAVESDAVLGPEPSDQFNPFRQPPDPVGLLDAEHVRLFLPVAEPARQVEPAVADHIDDCRQFGDVNMVLQRQEKRPSANIHVLGFAGERREDWEVLEVVIQLIAWCSPIESEPNSPSSISPARSDTDDQPSVAGTVRSY